jgi:8-oxo-dGTP pyrophosphatase MutT (NUDIX family)
MTPLKQVAALPYVDTADDPLVLLITTCGSGRWSISKGWPKAGIADHETAAREAFEEAGIKGEVGARPIGSLLYTKRLHLLSWVKCSVDVYPLHAHCQTPRRRRTSADGRRSQDLARQGSPQD